MQVLGGDLVGQRAGLVGVAGQDHRAELLQALPGQLAALQAGQLPRQARPPPPPAPPRPSRSARWPPGRARPGRSGPRPCSRAGSSVDDHHHLARPGDRIDVHLAEDVLLGQGHEQVARPDDLVHPRNALDAVGQGGHGLGAAQPIDLADAQLVAGGQQVGVVRAELRRRGDHGQLLARRPPGRARPSSARSRDRPRPRPARRSPPGPSGR